MSLVEVAKEEGCPVIFTLHDFWLMCPRGQFMQMHSGDDLWAACDGQDDRKCAMTSCQSCNHVSHSTIRIAMYGTMLNTDTASLKAIMPA